MDINNQTSEGYVPLKEARIILDTTPKLVDKICDDFGIRRIKIDSDSYYYCLEDINRTVEFVSDFFQNHYPYKDIEGNYTISGLESQGIYYIETPSNYGRLLKSKYPDLRTLKFYKKDDIHRFEKILSEKFIDRNETLDIFKIPSRRFILNPLAEGFNIETMQKANSTIYNKADVESAMNEVLSFSQSHYLVNDVLAKGIDIAFLEAHNIYPIDVPSHYWDILKNLYGHKSIASIKVMYEKDVIDDFIANNNTDIKSVLNSIKNGEPIKTGYFNILFENEMCVSSKKAIELLGFESSSRVNLKHLNSICESGYLRIIMPKGTPYYYVPDIEDIKKRREEYFKKYVPRNASNELYCKQYGTEHKNLTRGQLGKNALKIHDIPNYCIGLTETYGTPYILNGAFEITELKKYLEGYAQRKESVIDTSIIGENRMDTFYLRLEKYPHWKPFSDETKYTNEKTLQLIENTLTNCKGKDKEIDNVIRQCILLLTSVRDVLEKYNVSEIYLITDNELNLHMKSIQYQKVESKFYNLLKSINMDFKKIGQGKKLRFNMENIKLPTSNSNDEDIQKDIYDFETYSDVFNYLVDIDTHITKSIEMIEKNDSVQYASIWLYCILHLNNAWRNGDCDRFPELTLKDFLEDNQISDISWFKENRLTLPQAKSVIFRVRQWEMRMSKTQMKGVFFCSDELAPAFASAVIILSLYKYNNTIIDDSVVDSKKDNLIMDFDNRYNEVKQSMLKTFFKPAKIKNFTFSSRKFNRTIMTYVYLLANLNGDAKAVVYSQELRGHVEQSSTLNYICFDISKVESLGRQLFQRGEFGYISTLLTSKVLGEGNTGSFEEMTNRVIEINNAFGGVQGIVDNTRALNIIRSERQLVIDMISEKSFKESQEILTDMFARNLSSKCSSDIQCLFGRDSCKMPHLDDEDDYSCFDCPYHIPSIYALSNLCSSLVANLKDYLGIPRYIKAKDCKDYIINNQNSISKMNKKTLFRTGLKIKRRKVILKEAIDKYGMEYVYECLGLEREDFLMLSDLVTYYFKKSFPEIK